MTRPIVDSANPGTTMDFLRTRTPNFFSTATRASTATWFDQYGILRDAATNEMRFDCNPTGIYWNNALASTLSRWNTALNNVRNKTGHARIYAIGDSTTRGDGLFNYLEAFRTQFPDVPCRSDGFSGNGQAPISAITTITEFSGAWTNSLADSTFFSTVGGWLFKHPGSAAGNFTVTPRRPASRMRLWFYGYFTGSGTARVIANGAPRADINTNLYNNQYTFIDVDLGATSTNPVNMVWQSGGPLWIGGVEFFNDSLFEVNIINAGWYGGTGTELAFDNGRPNAPLNAVQGVNADLIILSCGINDAAQSKTLTEYRTNMQNIINKGLAAGSSIVCDGQNPASPNNINYVNVMRAVAHDNNLPYIDFYRKWGGSLAAAQTAGLVSGDNIHPTPAGYVDKGNTLGKFVQGSLFIPNRGLLIESPRTNLVRNNTTTGAVAGSPGTVPTNNSIFGIPAGITRTLGLGTEDGMQYLDVGLVGTPAANGDIGIAFELNNGIAAVQNEQVTLSVYIKIQNGTTTNVSSPLLVINEFDAAPTFLTSGTTAITLSSNRTRHTFTHTVASATAAFAQPFLQVSVTSGQAIDITLRIYYAQVEKAPFATSIIKTTSATVTRASDNLVSTSLSSLNFRSDEGTLYVEYELEGLSTLIQRAAFFDNNTNNERIPIGTSSTVGNAAFSIRTGGVDQTSTLFHSGITAFNVVKHAAAYRVDDIASSANGSAVLTDNLATLPVGINTLRIGQEIGSTNYLNGWLRRFIYYPIRLSNAKLQELST